MENFITHLKPLILAITKILMLIFEYRLVVVSGNEIMVSNIVCALIVLWAAAKYSRQFTALVRAYLKKRIKNDESAINSLEKLISYASAIVLAILILQIANIPLSSFAFIGGALAIGVGLGAQNLMNNFISSLIIMIEKPIKIGDIVEIEGVVGTVTSIGIRCVTITTFAKVQVLIANSKIVQSSLVNLTASDKLIEIKVAMEIPRNGLVESEDNKSIDFTPSKFIKQVRQVIERQKWPEDTIDPVIYLDKIDNQYFHFTINLYCDLTQLQDLTQVKSKLNLALIEEFKDYKPNIQFQDIVEKRIAEKKE